MNTETQVPNRVVFLVATGWTGFLAALFLGVFGILGVIPLLDGPRTMVPTTYALLYVALTVVLAASNGVFMTWYFSRSRKVHSMR